MTREELAKHEGPVWVHQTQETAIPIANWSLPSGVGRVLLGRLLAMEDQVYPSEQACLESLLERQMTAIRIASGHIGRIEARIAKLNGGADKGI